MGVGRRGGEGRSGAACEEEKDTLICHRLSVIGVHRHTDRQGSRQSGKKAGREECMKGGETG